MNQLVITGVLKDLPVKLELHSEEMFLCHIVDTKNKTFPMLVTPDMANNILTYFKVGDTIGIKGALDSLIDIFGNNSLYVSPTKVSYISSAGGTYGQD